MFNASGMGGNFHGLKIRVFSLLVQVPLASLTPQRRMLLALLGMLDGSIFGFPSNPTTPIKTNKRRSLLASPFHPLLLLHTCPKVPGGKVPDEQDDLDSFGMSEEETPDPAASEPPVLFKSANGNQVLVIPSCDKECVLPGKGKKGGCEDWILTVIASGSGEPKKYQIQSEKNLAKSRFVDQLVASTRLCQPIQEDTIAECRRQNMVPKTSKNAGW